MSDKPEQSGLLGLTAQIVSAHVANNSVQASALPELINSVYQALTSVGSAPVTTTRPEPAVPIKKSVFPDYLICLEDGKKLKMLKRHLMTSYGMTAEEYRVRWDLPENYPMVAPNYAQKRSSLAKAIGLGRKQPAPEPEPEADIKPRRGRKPKR
jgi:predicted transcriptional regulator